MNKIKNNFTEKLKLIESLFFVNYYFIIIYLLIENIITKIDDKLALWILTPISERIVKLFFLMINKF